MELLKKIIETITNWIGPVGLLFILLIVLSTWMYYDLIEKNPLNLQELMGLVLFSIIVVALGNFLLKICRKKKR